MARPGLGKHGWAAGVNQRMLYHYFGFKEGIWEAPYRELTQWLAKDAQK